MSFLAHLVHLTFEPLETLGCPDRRLRVAGELGEPRREIGFVLPTRRQCRGIADLRIIRKQRRRLLARLGKCRECFFRLVEIERPLSPCRPQSYLAPRSTSSEPCGRRWDRFGQQAQSRRTRPPQPQARHASS